MSEARADTIRKQARASAPDGSAWVSANAGSGKTFVLARRVLRLLLNGAGPGSLVCLTYTRTAAAEMQGRVFRALAEWTRLTDDELNTVLSSGYSIKNPDAGIRARARTLFANATETPGGLKIQTIHAFCERVLHQFPLEANVPGRFQVIDDRLKEELMRDARKAVTVNALAEPESAIGKALALLLEDGSDETVTAIVEAVTKEQEKLRAWHDAFPDLPARQNSLAAGLGETRYRTPEEIGAVANAVLQENRETWRAVQSVLSNGSKSEVTASETLAKALSNGDPALLTTLFVTQGGQPRKRSLFVKKTAQANPDLFNFLEEQKEVLAGAAEAGRITHCIDRSIAAIGFGLAVAGLYDAEKLRRGALDYDDLIEKTRALLTSSDAALWVQFKLDHGIDHILVDEAQDTSPAQWDIVRALSEEFFAGETMRSRSRTVFAVGDEKQSIFSFQGASPKEFDRQKESYRHLSEMAEKGFSAEQLEISFRSTPAVLSAVDEVFRDPGLSKSLTAGGEPPVHRADRAGSPGFVEIWPLCKKADDGEPEDWTTPVDRKSAASDPMGQLAERIAETVSGWTEGKLTGPVGRASVRPQDIMILVRERKHMLTLNRALKARDVPVAGIDRFHISTHIATDDLMALIQFVLLPEDDLNLACLLRSPLVGISEDDLFTLAHDRNGTLHAALAEKAAEDGAFAGIPEKLERWRDLARFLTPYRFISRVLFQDGGKRAFRARLGLAVDDILDEFLNLTIAYEDHHPASLQGFHAFMSESDEEIKRQMDEARNEVRIMTVHGAKGLEAPIVFLVDDSGLPGTGRRQPKLVYAETGRVALPYWQPAEKDRPQRLSDVSATHKLAAYDEYLRLLYVAMTRAEDALVVCGVEKQNRAPDDAWHAIILKALEEKSDPVIGPDGETFAWRFMEGDPEGGEAVRHSAPSMAEFTVPDWLEKPAPLPSPAALYQPASGLGRDTSGFSRPREAETQESIDAARKGTLVHTLFEHLPNYPAETRRDAAARYLERRAGDLAPDLRAAILREVFQILDDPLHAPLFGPGSRAELPVAGRVRIGGKEQLITGRIDRLYRSDTSLVIVDFKTNRFPPEKGETPRAYALQLGAYAQIMEDLHPGLKVSAALLWTALPRLDLFDRDTLHGFMSTGR